MTRTRRKALSALILTVGLLMLVWGGSSFTHHPKPKPPPTDPEDAVLDLWHDVIGSPTTGEMLTGLVTGPVGRKMGALLVACVGLTLASGAALSLAPRRSES
jgi:hypothetical protein